MIQIQVSREECRVLVAALMAYRHEAPDIADADMAVNLADYVGAESGVEVP